MCVCVCVCVSVLVCYRTISAASCPKLEESKNGANHQSGFVMHGMSFHAPSMGSSFLLLAPCHACARNAACNFCSMASSTDSWCTMLTANASMSTRVARMNECGSCNDFLGVLCSLLLSVSFVLAAEVSLVCWPVGPGLFVSAARCIIRACIAGQRRHTSYTHCTSLTHLPCHHMQGNVFQYSNVDGVQQSLQERLCPAHLTSCSLACLGFIALPS